MGDKYQTHVLNMAEAVISAGVRDEAETLDELISRSIVDCREKSLAITKLEECAMWANKAIAMHGVNKYEKKGNRNDKGYSD